LSKLEYNGIWFSGSWKLAGAEDLGNDKHNNDPARPIETPADSRATVLVIEDDSSMLELMVSALENAGFAVLVAANGKIGFQIAVERKIDIVVTDIFMPVTDGIETIRKLRSHAPTLPIVAISGSNPNRMSDILAMSLKLGATETISKPFLPSALVETVAKLARAHR
jgi:CheY-like chemotaxis protein